MAGSLKDLYRERSEVFRFKGNRPGESMDTKIDELALIGDAYLALSVKTGLVILGFNPAEITSAVSLFLSNACLAEAATALELPVDRGNAVHASGTLLEAIIGLWYLAKFRQSSSELADTYEAAVASLISSILSSAELMLNRRKGIDSLFD